MLKIQRGFTIVELLIVIVVIGILAAITLVAFNGVQNRARAASANSAVTNASKKIKIWQVDNPGTITDCPTFSSLVGAATSTCTPTVGDATYEYSQSVPTSFCITATVGNKSYKITESGSSVAGGCPGHSQGGVAAITNYALNPNAAGASTAAFGTAGSSPVAATRTIASDQSHTGGTSLKVVITGASGQTGAQMKVPTQGLRVNTGEKVWVSLWIYSTKAGSVFPYMDGARVSDGTYVGGAAANVTIPANTWTKVTGAITAGVDLYVTQIGAYNLQVVSGDIVWFDEYMVTKTNTVQNYADGDSVDWTWNGTANNATSTGPPL